MRHLVLGTAGHIDHGKTALVRALTGTDTDRLPEEKQRGITIDLGFARMPLPAECELGIVDVPGHEAFVRNMLAGATGMDLVLLVIAADEGPMPQTREHLAIVELLGITRGVVALTKTDLVDADWLDLVREDVDRLLNRTALAGAPVVAVSARTGAGLDVLRGALADAARDAGDRAADDLFRMPIDRVFTVHGTGTVVTGTVWSGTLARDQHVRIEPAGVTARVRALQQHGAECGSVGAGARAAVAITGIDRHDLRRGDTLLGGDGWAPGSILTVDLTALADAAAPIRPRQRVRVHVGTAEVLGRIGLLAAPLEPGEQALAQLRLETPVIARAGDHVVIRTYSPLHTIGGGIVLEPDAPKRKRLTDAVARALAQIHDPARSLSAAVSLAGPAGLAISRLPVLTGLPPRDATARLDAADDVSVTGDRAVLAGPLDACAARMTAALDTFHAAQPLADGPEREAVRKQVGHDLAPFFDAALGRLTASGAVVLVGSALALASHTPTPDARQQSVLVALRDAYAAAGLAAPDIAELPAALAGRDDLTLLVRHLERTGSLVRLGATRWVDAGAVRAAVAAVRAALESGPVHPVSAYRDVLGVTRKHLLPLLECLDRAGVTARQGDGRILLPGPDLDTIAS